MAVVGVELETLVSELDALTIRPPPCALLHKVLLLVLSFTPIKLCLFKKAFVAKK